MIEAVCLEVICLLQQSPHQPLQKLQEEKKALEGKRSELITVKDELAAQQKQLLELEDRRGRKITSLEVDIKRLQTENEQYQKQLDHLKSHKDLCPTCGQNIGEDKNKEINVVDHDILLSCRLSLLFSQAPCAFLRKAGPLNQR